MTRFDLKCLTCGADDSFIQTHFHKGLPNTHDKMVVLCRRCGYEEHQIILWPMPVGKAPENLTERMLPNIHAYDRPEEEK
jgi:hypothetical protein